ncbi:MAG TPA: T9SS type A sorting domain-containing protein [Ignavibacteria bacterium]|nr:T9SS type A sorting domain-containing protein [Ignavibacteria bacterium]
MITKLKFYLYLIIIFFQTSVVLSQLQPDQQDNIESLNAYQNIIEQWDNYFYENYISKGIDTKGSGYKQFMREKFEYEMNKTISNNFTEQRRIEKFRESRLKILNSSEKQISSEWINLGPNTIDSMGGRMTSHAFDPVDPEIIWAGSASGGIWKTTNGGDRWESMTDDLPSMIISDLEIDPNDRNTILAGTGNDKFMSIVLGPGVGVLKSTNNGVSWYQTAFNFQTGQNVSVSKIIWKPGSTDSIYMAASNGIWLSKDKGETWSVIKSGRASSLVIDETSPENLYAIMRADGVYRSSDGGVTWSLLNNGIIAGPNIGFSAITISKSDPGILYVSLSDVNVTASLGVYKTTDRGNSWNQITNAPNALCAPNNPSLCQGWYVNLISVSPLDPNLIFYGGITFWRSSNGGANWLQLDVYNSGAPNSAGKTFVDQWDIGYNKTDPEMIYLFNDGGIFKTTDNGLYWNKANNNLVTGLVYRIASSPTDTNLIIGGFQDMGLQKLDNTGGNKFWKRWSDNDGTNVIIDPDNNSIFYGDFFLGTHRKSTNAGATWQSNFSINNGITESGALIAPLVMHPQNSSTLYTSSTAKIYKTTNGGTLWTPVANIPNVVTMAIDIINPEIIYAHAYDFNNWAFWKSVNGGDNWSRVTSSSIPGWRVTDLESDPANSGVVYATRNSSSFNQDHIKRSTDFGETWTNITGNLPDIFVYAITVSPVNNQHIYLATELGVYASTSGGSDWFPFNDGLPIVRTYDIHYHPLDRTVRIATIGRGVWKAKAIDNTVGIANAPNTLPGDFKLYQNYPNPFNPSTKIKYDILKKSKIKIEIYDMSGQKIRTLTNEIKESGSYETQWDPNENSFDLSSGVYYLRLTANNYSRTIKMTYLK